MSFERSRERLFLITNLGLTLSVVQFVVSVVFCILIYFDYHAKDNHKIINGYFISFYSVSATFFTSLSLQSQIDLRYQKLSITSGWIALFFSLCSLGTNIATFVGSVDSSVALLLFGVFWIALSALSSLVSIFTVSRTRSYNKDRDVSPPELTRITTNARTPILGI